MTIQAFMHDPKSYLSTHQMTIGNSALVMNCTQADPAVGLPGGLTRQRWRQIAAGPFPTFTSTAHAAPKTTGDKVKDTLRHLPLAPRKMIHYTLGNTNPDPGMRYLPFNPNHVTYMDIPAGAAGVQLVMTGPLTGCTIAALPAAGGGFWFIHSNQNAGAGMVGAIAAQLTGIQDLVNHLGLLMGAVITCTYGTDYNGMGFVFGRLAANGVWKFYSHATSAAGNTVTRKWGEL